MKDEDVPRLRPGNIVEKEDTYYRIEEIKVRECRLFVRSMTPESSSAYWVDHLWFAGATRIP